jgi:hypothetical protein
MGGRIKRRAGADRECPATIPREISSRSASASHRADRRGTSGGRPPVAATSVRSASIVRPSVRLIDRSDAPARYARQISAFSGTVNADRTITTTSVAHEQASPVRQGDAFIP